MSKQGNDSKAGVIYVASLILIEIIVGVFTALISTSSDKAEAKKQMNEVSQYVRQQCVRYEELNTEDTARSLYDVSDKAFAIRSAIDYSPENIEADICAMAEGNRMNGIFISESDGATPAGKIVAYYSDGDESDETWKDYFAAYGSVAGDIFKSYCERVSLNGNYYDCAIVSRNDGKGAVLCYKRRSVEDVEDDRLSITTLLKGYLFGSDGVVVVTDGNIVLAANADGIVGTPAKDCAVIRKLRQSDTVGDLVRIEDEGVFYGVRAECKNLFVYTYMPDSEVFARRAMILSYVFMFYMLIVIAVIVVRQVVLRKKRIEQQIKDEEYRIEKERLAQEAIRANEVKTDFLRRMSHDIRTPINGIRGMVKIGEYYYDDLEKQKECREKIWDASGYLLDLVNDVLDLNKLSTSEPAWKDETFVLSDLLEEIESFVDVQAKEAGVALTIEARDVKHDCLFGGKIQFKRILTNLLGNAIKYNRQGGKVELICTEKYDKEGVAYFECKCSDTGIGMDEEFIKKMYEPFEREKQSEGNNLEGVGLGLAIVKKLVDKAGWTIDAESKKGEGTSFTVNVSFKIAESPKKVAELSAAGEKNRLKGFNVLVAEDNELNFEIVKFMLEVEGANVIAATDGKQAVDIFDSSEAGSIDAILMDVMMPVEDGLQATREIRASGRTDAEAIPIIAMTASAFADDVENARTAGMNAHIAKPLDEEKLISCILRLVKKRGGGGIENDA